MSEELKILCPFCSKPYTGEMLVQLFGVGEWCESCGYGGEPIAKIEIKCTNCEKIVYVKEIEE